VARWRRQLGIEVWSSGSEVWAGGVHLHIDGTALRLMRMDEVTCPGGLPEREEAAVSPTLSTQHSLLSGRLVVKETDPSG
jgi:hypothetical protein